MNRLAVALGREPVRRERCRIVLLMGASVLTFCAIGQAIAFAGETVTLVSQAVAWILWFVWQGWFFPRNRDRLLLADPETAYRRAFYRQILPGVGAGVALMMRPGIYGLVSIGALPSAVWIRALSDVLFAVGLTLLVTAFKTIGFDGAGFLYEYENVERPFSRRSIFGQVRHPLFVGGVIMSVGAGVAFWDTVTLGLAAMSLGALAAYSRVEHARLTRIVGPQYLDYCAEIPTFVPRFLRDHVLRGLHYPARGRFLRRGVPE